MRRNALLLTLAFCATTLQSAQAQSDLGLKGVGLAVGIVSPEDLDATFGFGVSADMGSITPQIRLEPTLDYWSKSEDVFGGEFSVQDIMVGAVVKYYFTVSNPKLRPFAGGGLGLHFLNAEVEMVDPFTGGTMTVEDSSTKLGLHFGGGIGTPLNGRTSFVADAWFRFVSDFSQYSLRVGLLHSFGS